MQLALGYRPNRMPIECFGVSHEINERSGPFGWLHLLHCKSGRFHLAFVLLLPLEVERSQSWTWEGADEAVVADALPTQRTRQRQPPNILSSRGLEHHPPFSFHQKENGRDPRGRSFAHENPSVKQQPSCRRAGGDSQRPRLEYFWRWPEPTGGPACSANFPPRYPTVKSRTPGSTSNHVGLKVCPNGTISISGAVVEGFPRPRVLNGRLLLNPERPGQRTRKLCGGCQQHSNPGKQTAATLSHGLTMHSWICRVLNNGRAGRRSDLTDDTCTTRLMTRRHQTGPQRQANASVT